MGPGIRVYSMCSCTLGRLALVYYTSVWGFVLCGVGFPLHISRSDSKASGVSSAQLHPPLVARFALEVTGAES